MRQISNEIDFWLVVQIEHQIIQMPDGNTRLNCFCNVGFFFVSFTFLIGKKIVFFVSLMRTLIAQNEMFSFLLKFKCASSKWTNRNVNHNCNSSNKEVMAMLCFYFDLISPFLGYCCSAFLDWREVQMSIIRYDFFPFRRTIHSLF